MGTNSSLSDILLQKNIAVIDDFISEALCAEIIQELDLSHWQASSVLLRDKANRRQNVVSPSRLSQTAHSEFFTDNLLAIVKKIENNVAALIQSDPAKFEYWQGTKYPIGGKFDFHLDCGSWAKDKAGERKRTILLYLDTPKQGGSTMFRALNLKIVPKVGRLVVWNNLFPNGDCNYGMVHAGMPVWKGRKTTLVTWERLRNYRTSQH